MNSILEALYNGRLRPDETMMPTHPEYQLLGRQIATMTEQWKNRLSEEEFRELEQLFDLWGQWDGMHSEADMHIQKQALDPATKAARSEGFIYFSCHINNN